MDYTYSLTVTKSTGQSTFEYDPMACGANVSTCLPFTIIEAMLSASFIRRIAHSFANTIPRNKKICNNRHIRTDGQH